jgi:hypothetical protein
MSHSVELSGKVNTEIPRKGQGAVMTKLQVELLFF